MLIFQFGQQNYWCLEHKVTFDGTNKLILINPCVTCINLKEDVYSAWKQWVQVETNSGFTQALASTGGDPTPNGFIGATFFLENCWKIRTWEGDHTLNLTGNIFARDGSAITVPTVQDHSITVSSFVSNLICVPNIPLGPVAEAVWDELLACHTSAGTTGAKLDDLGNKIPASCISVIVDAVWDEILSAHATAGSAGQTLTSTLSPCEIGTIVDAVWDECICDHLTACSTGDKLKEASIGGTLCLTPCNISDIASGVWEEPTANHTTVGTFGKLMGKIKTILSILFTK